MSQKQIRYINTQSGRSMVEMLGTLAIMGVLTIGGIAGYRYAINKNRSNELIHFLYQTTVLTKAQSLQGRLKQSDIQSIIDQVDSNYVATAVMCSSSGSDDLRYTIHVSDVSKGVCDIIMRNVDDSYKLGLRAINVHVGSENCAIGSVDCSDEKNAIAFIFEPDDIVRCEGDNCSDSTGYECFSDEYRCNGNRIESCLNGSWVSDLDCGSDACIEGSSEVYCESSDSSSSDGCYSDENRCNGDVIESCVSGQWEAIETCSSGNMCVQDSWYAYCGGGNPCPSDGWCDCSGSQPIYCTGGFWIPGDGYCESSCDSGSSWYSDSSSSGPIGESCPWDGMCECFDGHPLYCTGGTWDTPWGDFCDSACSWYSGSSY